MRTKSLSEKRLIVNVTVNGKEAPMLIDTGASAGILSHSAVKKYNLVAGRDFPTRLQGAGGEFSAKWCKTMAYLGEKVIPQFLIADIDNVIASIHHETGIRIVGIISLPQMKIAGITIDTDDNYIEV